MPVVRLNDEQGTAWYIDWSNACDAPKSCAMTRAEMRAYLRDKELRVPIDAGQEALEEFTLEVSYVMARIDRALDRCDRRGVSICDYPVESGEQFVTFNRAGPKEGSMKPANILKMCIAEREQSRLPKVS